MSESLLKALELMLRGDEHSWGDRRFVDEEKLCGVKVEWLRMDLHNDLCELHDIDPDQCDIIKIVASGITGCHQHKKASCMFKILSCSYKFLEKDTSKKLSAGILTAEREGGQNEYVLKPLFYEVGQTFTVHPRQMHAFFSDPSNSVLTLIGITHPKIRVRDEVYFYDMSRIPYVPSLEYARVRIGTKKDYDKIKTFVDLQYDPEK